MSRIDETIDAKKQKRAQLEQLGIHPHPYLYSKQHTILECRTMMDQQVQTAGRIISTRAHGKVAFLDLQDSTAKIQVMVRKSEVDKEKFSWLKNLVDRGDFLGVQGLVTTTKTGEITILASDFEFMGKALRPIPTEFNAAESKESRFRKRYLDMLINPETKKILDTRWLILKEIRRFLQDEHGFIEVETPALQPLYGGTNATPFTTHMEALDTDYYLRIASELYLKRFIVGGYDKVFDIAKDFRNEGIDQTHQPEFTMLEWYETYADYTKVMEVAEHLIKHLAQKIHGELKLTVGEKEIDISGDWPKITMKAILKSHADIDFDSQTDDQLKSLLAKHSIQLKSAYTRGKALFELFDTLVTPQLIEPIWIIDYPRDISPLSKKHRHDPELAERFEAYIGGKEIADGWSEIVDALDQRSIFENEQKNMRQGDIEAHPLDEDFLEAMEYGMPPLGGIGIGIDRLVMFLTNTWSIREVIAFPTLKPLHTQKHHSSTHDPKHLQTEKTQAQQKKNVAMSLPTREASQKLLDEYIKNKKLAHHCLMVAAAMEAYARQLGEDEELWYHTGLLHDLDWESYPDEHPNKALAEFFDDYPEEMKQAIAAHAPDRTGKYPESTLDKYLFACDELSGLMHAVSLMRPNGFADMKPKSIKKKLKDKSFAANVSREDIMEGVKMIDMALDEHIGFMTEVFKQLHK